MGDLQVVREIVRLPSANGGGKRDERNSHGQGKASRQGFIPSTIQSIGTNKHLHHVIGENMPAIVPRQPRQHLVLYGVHTLA